MAAAAAKKDARETQATKWVATVYDCEPGNFFYESVVACTSDKCAKGKPFKWVVLGAERTAPTEEHKEGRWHAQCFLVTHKPVRRDQVVDYLNNCDAPIAPHVEKANGSYEQNYNYCTGLVEKKGNKRNPHVWEAGNPPEAAKYKDNGEREKSQWDEAWREATVGNICNVRKDIAIRYYNNLKSIRVDADVQNLSWLEAPCGLWLYGATGAGKSFYAHRKFPNAYIKNRNKWWCGYEYGGDAVQKHVIIEEVSVFDRDNLGNQLKQWADIYPFKGETKGASMMLRPKSIVVTSNYAPTDIWPDAETLDPILRRFKILKFELEDDGTRKVTQENPKKKPLVELPPGSVIQFNDKPIVFETPSPKKTRTQELRESLAREESEDEKEAARLWANDLEARIRHHKTSAPLERVPVEEWTSSNLGPTGTQPLEVEMEAERTQGAGTKVDPVVVD